MAETDSPGNQRAFTCAAEPEASSFASETERQVAQIFAEILELQWVSPEDDIFKLGGDSFEAVRIALELEHRFDIELPVELLESAARVRDLAAWIDSHGGRPVKIGTRIQS
jgi:acyl carrier protein